MSDELPDEELVTDVVFMEDPDNVLEHIGVLHKSGRYPWGSGEDPYQRSSGFLQYVSDMRKQGLTDTQIAEAMGIKTTEFRAANTLAKNAVKNADISRAMMLKDKNMSNSAIARQMGKNESTIRALLNEDNQRKATQLQSTANILKDRVKEKTYVDVGTGAEHFLGTSDNTVKNAVALLREEGYNLFYLKVPQLGTTHDTTVKVLAPPDATYSDLLKHRDEVSLAGAYSNDGGSTYKKLVPPTQMNSKRLAVRYGSEGGADMDGVIELRRDTPDISLGNARYAQVRIAFDKTHYAKGMAIYADDLPDGVDIRFNTNKESTGNKLDALKKQKTNDPSNPFGSMVRQKNYVGSDGKDHLSPLNIVNEEGDWGKWSSKLSSQFLSKQPIALAKEQLAVRYDMLQSELESISKLTNPTVKKKLLQSFSDAADSDAVYLKAAGLPRTATKVILPMNSLRDNEIYAPTYNNGEKVVLVRHPHGGIFEIPELTVNNRNKEAKRLIPNAADAVGINSKVAARLSGADFDGDSVLVIPNNAGKVKTSPALAALKDFNPQTAYPKYEGMKVMSPADKQHKMGDISNLITDMTIRGASQAELARAVKHSMVVIDAEKHELNHKQSYIDNNIAQLKKEYQGDAKSGATTLISRAKSRVDVPLRKPRPAKEGGPIDIATGELKYVPKGDSFIRTKVDKRTGEVSEEVVVKTFKSKKLAETNDAHTLTSGKPIEAIYADHSNRLKSLANSARKEMVLTKNNPVSTSARVTYAPEVALLKSALNVALKNAPLERRAQVVANALLKAKTDANPGMDSSDIKKAKSLALEEARANVGAKKTQIQISDRQWEAIQAGAVSANILEKILNNTDLDRVKELATPRTEMAVSSANLSRARSMLASGYTQAEVAEALGLSVSTLSKALSPTK